MASDASRRNTLPIQKGTNANPEPVSASFIDLSATKALIVPQPLARSVVLGVELQSLTPA